MRWDDVEGDSGNSNNGDGFDDSSGVNINGGYDANCGDGESMVDYSDDKDVGVVMLLVIMLLVVVVVILFLGMTRPKLVAVMIQLVTMVIVETMMAFLMTVVVLINKMMVMTIMLMVVAMMKEEVDAKDGDRDDGEDKDDTDFEDDDGVKCKFLQFIFVAFPQFLMWILHFLVQLDVYNFCAITMGRVIGLYEPSYDLL